jgi:hypothetical protein
VIFYGRRDYGAVCLEAVGAGYYYDMFDIIAILYFISNYPNINGKSSALVTTRQIKQLEVI